nr:hypothetical protein [Tanacetum cinerariifolium]
MTSKERFDCDGCRICRSVTPLTRQEEVLNVCASCASKDVPHLICVTGRHVLLQSRKFLDNSCFKSLCRLPVQVLPQNPRPRSPCRLLPVSLHLEKESWWFCEEVQTKVATKLSRFKELLSCREGNQEDIDMAKERYKAAKREAKEAVALEKDKAYEELYKRLDSKEGANDIYKIAKARERRRKDIGSTPADESRRDGSWEVGSSSLHRHFDCYYSRINQGEVRVALQKMGRNKAVGPDQIPIEAWKCLEEEGGDAQACSNYRGIKLLSNTINLWERVTERRVRRETRVSENQFAFMPGRSMTKAIHLLRSLMEKYRERQRYLHMAFLDLEKAYDSVLHELVWKTLIDKGTPSKYLKVIQDMYEGAKTRVRTIVGNTEFFPVEVGLHQGSAISPYLFTLILDELSRGIQENIPWCMIFADDIVLIAESAEGLNNRLERWRKALEVNGLRVSREKTEYLRCYFGRFEVAHQEVDIRIEDRILQPKESFRYLGSMIHRSGRIDEDSDSIIDKMREGRLRWFGHVKRRPQTAPVRRVEALLVEGSRRRGRPKLRWKDRLKLDMKELLLSEDMTSDRNAWRDRIRISEVPLWEPSCLDKDDDNNNIPNLTAAGYAEGEM